MILILNYNPVMDQAEFLDLLLSKIQQKIEKRINQNKKKLLNWDNYLNNNVTFKQLYNKNVQTIDILQMGVNNLIHRKVSNYLYIMINPTVMLNNKLSLSDFCNMIEQGNLEMSGVDIFSTIFQNIKNSIGEIILAYQYKILEKLRV